ncbi:MAG: hypothetical protein AAFQ14_05015 [Cyanobacteria bacterium J06621_12]
MNEYPLFCRQITGIGFIGCFHGFIGLRSLFSNNKCDRAYLDI